MALRDFSDVPYLPILGLRPAEMNALQELPSQSKDSLLPYFFLGPWGASNALSNSLARIRKAYADRPFVLELPIASPVENRRPVHDELDELRVSASGYQNWCDYVAAQANIVPSLQLSDPMQLDEQLERLSALGRGIAVRLPEEAFGLVHALASRVAQYFDPEEVLVVFDHARQSREVLTKQAAAVSISQHVWDDLPGCTLAWSASTFPLNFVGATQQGIYERQFFDGVTDQLPGTPLLYSDRGSARAERQNGGSGAPAPRIDFAQAGNWSFFREEDNGDRQAAYQAASVRAMDDQCWDPNLSVWGTQMIERTAQGDEYAIGSPPASTAARINIHLQQQLFYGNPDGLYDTEEEWTD